LVFLLDEAVIGTPELGGKGADVFLQLTPAR